MEMGSATAQAARAASCELRAAMTARRRTTGYGPHAARGRPLSDWLLGYLGSPPAARERDRRSTWDVGGPVSGSEVTSCGRSDLNAGAK
jgi:hypothetical protein